MTDFYVKHFVEAHEATIADVLTELRKGEKAITLDVVYLPDNKRPKSELYGNILCYR